MTAVRRRGREKEMLQQIHRGLHQSLLPHTGRLPYQLEVSKYFLSVRRRGREKEMLQQIHRGLLQSLLPHTGRLPYQLEVSLSGVGKLGSF
jgi:hypothetical protein